MQEPDNADATDGDVPHGWRLRRRDVLAGSTALFVLPHAQAQTFDAALREHASAPPRPPRPGPYQFFTADEARTIEAIVDRLIPPDPDTPGGKQAGCAFFIDRQLAGPYGRAAGLYMEGPFQPGQKTQGDQSPRTPAQLYRDGLAALAAYCQQQQGGRRFDALSPDEQDQLLTQLQQGKVQLGDVDAASFFDQLLQNTKEGFFADPVYGGNREMVGWKMIGFPGARYDHRPWVDQHNKKYDLPPVAIVLPHYGSK